MNLGKLIFWGVLVFSLLEISAFNHLTDNSKVTHRYQFDYMLPYNESQIFWNHQDLRGDYHNELYGWKIGDRTPLMPLVAQPFYKIFGDSFTTWEIYSLLCCSLLIFAVTLYSGSYWMGIIFALSTFFFYMSKQYPFRIEMTALYFMALYFAFKKNYWLSGLFCGLSYLCHPNILPWVVGLIGYTFLTNKKNDTLKLISLFAICFLVWMGFCKFYLHQNSVFYLYPFCTENWYEALAIPPKEILNHFLNVLTDQAHSKQIIHHRIISESIQDRGRVSQYLCGRDYPVAIFYLSSMEIMGQKNTLANPNPCFITITHYRMGSGGNRNIYLNLNIPVNALWN